MQFQLRSACNAPRRLAMPELQRARDMPKGLAKNCARPGPPRVQWTAWHDQHLQFENRQLDGQLPFPKRRRWALRMLPTFVNPSAIPRRLVLSYEVEVFRVISA